MEHISAAIRRARASHVTEALVMRILEKCQSAVNNGFDELKQTARGQRGLFAITSIAWAEAARLASLRGGSLPAFSSGWADPASNALAACYLIDNAVILLKRWRLEVTDQAVYEVYALGWTGYCRRYGIKKGAQPSGANTVTRDSDPSLFSVLGDTVRGWFDKDASGNPVGKTSVQQAFIDTFWPSFKRNLGPAAEYAFAHAANESAYGARRAGTKYNIFGIKSDAYKAAPRGPMVRTTEYEGGVAKAVMDSFADFQTVDEAVLAYRDLLTNPRRRLSKYKPLEATDAYDFGERLRKAGYFTDPRGSYKIADVHGKIFA